MNMGAIFEIALATQILASSQRTCEISNGMHPLVQKQHGLCTTQSLYVCFESESAFILILKLPFFRTVYTLARVVCARIYTHRDNRACDITHTHTHSHSSHVWVRVRVRVWVRV